MDFVLRALMSAGIILLSRWTFHLSTPQADLRRVVDYGSDATVALRQGVAMLRVWLVGLIPYRPTTDVEQAWAALRDRIAGGRYGLLGT